MAAGAKEVKSKTRDKKYASDLFHYGK